MSVCFSTRSSLRGSQRKEREKGGKMSLFSLKKHSLSLSLFLFLSSICFVLAVDSFFFSSLFVHFFSYWVRSSVGLLSLFFPFLGRSETTSSKVCLSLCLSYEARAFWKTRSPSRILRRTQKERGMIISEKEDKLARESRKKKDGLDFSSHRAEQQPQRVVASKTKTHISENKSVLPSVRPRGACLQNSFFLRCFNIYVCVYSVRSL